MKKKILKKINFDKINSIVIFLLIFSNLRYYKLHFSFININLFQLIGQIFFVLLILISFFYLLNFKLKDFKTPFLILLTWFFLSIFLNYSTINFLYLKNTFQIFYCLFLFIIFKNNKNKINLVLIENLLLFFLSLITLNVLLAFELYIISFILVLGFIIFVIYLRNNNFYYLFFGIFFLIFYLYLNIYIDIPYDYLDSEIVIRKNSLSWIILFSFLMIKIFSKNDQMFFDFFIFIFSLLFCAKYILFCLLIVIIFKNLLLKNTQILKISLFLTLSLTIVYVLTISLITEHYIFFINEIINSVFDLSNRGLAIASDQNYSIRYNISEINYKISGFVTEIYVGLIHRAILAKMFLLNVINNNIINDSYSVIINYYSYSDFNLNEELSKSDFFLNYQIYIPVCIEKSLTAFECFEIYNQENNSEISSKNFYQTIFTQSFNSSHNQIFDLIIKFKFLGIILILYFIFKIIEIIIKNKESSKFQFLIIIILLSLNFDNYLFYNYFNVSYLLWMLLGLSNNLQINLVKKN